MSLILFLYNVYKLKKRIILCEFEKGAIESFKASFCIYAKIADFNAITLKNYVTLA